MFDPKMTDDEKLNYCYGYVIRHGSRFPFSEDGLMPPPMEWAWKPWAATGTVTGLGGAPGVGKSTIAQQIATHKAIGKAYLESLPVMEAK